MTMDLGRHQPKNVPLPKPGSAARYLVEQWQQAGKIAWADAEGIYMFRIRQQNPQKKRQYATQNLLRILRKYGFKDGAPNTRTPWVFGAKFPTPGTFAPPVVPPPILPATVMPRVFGIGDMVTCNKIGRSVVAEIVERSADGWFKIRWPNALTDNVPGDLLQLVSPAEPGCLAGCPIEPPSDYKSQKTIRLEKELDESRESDKIQTWAITEAKHLKKIHSAQKICALIAALEDPQYVDPEDEENYDA